MRLLIILIVLMSVNLTAQSEKCYNKDIKQKILKRLSYCKSTNEINENLNAQVIKLDSIVSSYALLIESYQYRSLSQFDIINNNTNQISNLNMIIKLSKEENDINKELIKTYKRKRLVFFGYGVLTGAVIFATFSLVSS